MARVTVVGAGIAGLATALYATTAGHHVVVLDRTDRLGGRATSQTIENAPFGYGLHLLQKRGPLANLIKKISRLPLVLAAPRLDRLHVVNEGLLRPRNNVRLAATYRRALRQGDATSPIVQAATLLAGSGTKDSNERFRALLRQRLCVVGEGWAGVVGRMAAALDEVGVLIEPNCTVQSVESGKVILEDGRTFESDVVVLACGYGQAARLLRGLDDHDMTLVTPVRASTVDVTLAARPLGPLHGIIDAEEGAYVVDTANIQQRWHLEGAFLSAVMTERPGEDGEARLERLERFIDLHAVGWRKHVLHERKQPSIVVQTVGQKPTFDAFARHGVLLAGEWVACEHTLADAAAFTGRQAGQNIATALR
ncbi:MAG: FAD-dependent oxidoreductase [Poseidonia sp.]|jgi:glycine/D-amino acid oxidase-like deaminating enzyme